MKILIFIEIFIIIQLLINFIFFHIAASIKIIIISKHVYSIRTNIINHKTFLIIIKLYILYNSSNIMYNTYIPLKIWYSFIKIAIKNILILQSKYRKIRIGLLKFVHNITIVYIYHKNHLTRRLIIGKYR